MEPIHRHSGGIQALIAAASLAVAILALLHASAQPGAQPREITLPATPNQLVSSNDNAVPANGDSGRPALDQSGRFIAFTSVASNLADNAGGQYNVYLKDRETGSIHLASPGASGAIPDGNSQFPTICSTGRWVAFASTATNLLGSGPVLRPHTWRVYVHDTLPAPRTW